MMPYSDSKLREAWQMASPVDRHLRRLVDPAEAQSSRLQPI
jgi:hypothetical protein